MSRGDSSTHMGCCPREIALMNVRSRSERTHSARAPARTVRSMKRSVVRSGWIALAAVSSRAESTIMCSDSDGCITCSCRVGTGRARSVVRAPHEAGWESGSSGVDEREGGGGE